MHHSRSGRPAAAMLGVVSGIAALCLLPAGCDSSTESSALQKINGSVHVLAGNIPSVAETINGGIAIDDNAAVTVANTVNGGIRLGSHATADKLNTVNGNITLEAAARVAKSAETVNGAITLQGDAQVVGGITNVNGNIELTGAQVQGGITTVNGDITINGPSRIEGGILVQKSGELVHLGGIPRIVIGPGATVQGELRFEREVKLYVSDKATIGTVTGATPIAFAGNTPPAS